MSAVMVPIDTTDLYAIIRRNVREMLIERGMTQRELAARMEMPYSTLNKKLRGVHQTWWVTDMCKLWGAFGFEQRVIERIWQGYDVDVDLNRSRLTSASA